MDGTAVSNPPRVSVIVRAKDKVDTIASTFASIREQTVPAEIVVVDSGSTDGTLGVARELADVVVEIPAAEYSAGRALNVGARASRAPIHAAVSAHTVLPLTDWLERGLAHHELPDVAGACGIGVDPDGRPLLEPRLQAAGDGDSSWLRTRWGLGSWGFSNTASMWRASAWEEHAFDEHVTFIDDKQWAQRVLAAGWRLALDPRLVVVSLHRRKEGVRALLRRTYGEACELVLWTPMPPLRPGDALSAWWREIDRNEVTPPLFQRLNYFRAAEIAGVYAGSRRARRELAAGRAATVRLRR